MSKCCYTIFGIISFFYSFVKCFLLFKWFFCNSYRHSFIIFMLLWNTSYCFTETKTRQNCFLHFSSSWFSNGTCRWRRTRHAMSRTRISWNHWCFMLSNEHRGRGKNPKKEEKHVWPSFLFPREKKTIRDYHPIVCLYIVYTFTLFMLLNW